MKRQFIAPILTAAPSVAFLSALLMLGASSPGRVWADEKSLANGRDSQAKSVS